MRWAVARIAWHAKYRESGRSERETRVLSANFRGFSYNQRMFFPFSSDETVEKPRRLWVFGRIQPLRMYGNCSARPLLSASLLRFITNAVCCPDGRSIATLSKIIIRRRCCCNRIELRYTYRQRCLREDVGTDQSAIFSIQINYVFGEISMNKFENEMTLLNTPLPPCTTLT